jgi:hypothetical protein
MSWETHAVTPDRFDDFADVINRNRRTTHCWCLSHRLPVPDVEALGGGSREQAMRRLCEREHPPGVVTYLDCEPVGWCSIGPRSEIPRLARSRLMRPVDDVAVWSDGATEIRSGGERGDGEAGGNGRRGLAVGDGPDRVDAVPAQVAGGEHPAGVTQIVTGLAPQHDAAGQDRFHQATAEAGPPGRRTPSRRR